MLQSTGALETRNDTIGITPGSTTEFLNIQRVTLFCDVLMLRNARLMEIVVALLARQLPDFAWQPGAVSA
ncbi:MAG: hypothetical protein HKN70_07740 [Gammaproteobacteria bacterium]|nr:hypothetical protein [Gammaproteobacteria bacterium]